MQTKHLRFQVALAVAMALACLFILMRHPARAQRHSGTDTYAITNARIVTVSGPAIERGTVIIRDGLIAAVGAGIISPPDARIIDGTGLTVYPGIIDASTTLGIPRPTPTPATAAPGGLAALFATQSTPSSTSPNSTQLPGMQPEILASDIIRPGGTEIEAARNAGITTAQTALRGNVFLGQSAFINLAGSSPREMAVVPEAALMIQFPRVGGGGGFFQAQQAITPEAITQRDRRLEDIRRMLRDAEAYGRAQDAYRKDRKSVLRPVTDLKLAALVPYARGERPVIFRAEREREIRGAIRLAEEMKLKPIIIGASEGWKMAVFLKEHNVPVIIDSVLNLPLHEDDAYDSLFENAAKLQAAGVHFSISTGDSGAQVRDLPYQAGMAAAFGLSKAEALKSVTLYPAQIMGVADRMGSIEQGKIANLVIADGDMLEARRNIRYLFINGRQIPLVSRHTMLNDQFKDRK